MIRYDPRCFSAIFSISVYEISGGTEGKVVSDDVFVSFEVVRPCAHTQAVLSRSSQGPVRQETKLSVVRSAHALPLFVDVAFNMFDVVR